jgi:competence protein ComEC
VSFEVLHPPPHFPPLGNESSCVLRIAAGNHAILLPGDIGTVVEQRLVDLGTDLRADVLVLSHHGSRGGSGAPFLAAVAPALAIASAGQRNRFGHPAPEVVARVRDAGAALLHTGPGGALRLRIDPGGVAVVGLERRDAPRPWQEP